MVCQNQNRCNGLTSTVSESRGGLLSTARKRSWRVDSLDLLADLLADLLRALLMVPQFLNFLSNSKLQEIRP